MKNHDPHPVEHAGLDTIHHLISPPFMVGVSPPRQDVRLCEHFGSQAMLRFSKRREADAYVVTQLAPQAIRDCAVHAVRIDPPHRFLPKLVNVLVPNGHANLAGGRHQVASASPVREMTTGSRRVAESTMAAVRARVPRLLRPEVSGSAPVRTALATAANVPQGPVHVIDGSATVRALPSRGRITTLSTNMPSSSRLVQTTSPFWNSSLQSPAHGVTGPALIQLPR